MTILPPEPEPFSAGEPHHARQMAESFGEDPERYDRARPRYPQAMVDAIVAASPGRDVLDVGIGTGISARPFQAAGCRVLGVDVDPRMAAFARQRGLDVEVARFEDWDPAGRTFDAVILALGRAAVAGAAKAAEVLRPGGRLAVFWNVVQPPSDISEAFAAVYDRVLPGSPFSRGVARGLEAYSGQFTKTADGLREVARSASQSSGSSAGSGPTPGRSGWTRYRRPAVTASSRRAPWKSCWWAWGPPSTPSEAASPRVTRRWWSLHLVSDYGRSFARHHAGKLAPIPSTSRACTQHVNSHKYVLSAAGPRRCPLGERYQGPTVLLSPLELR